jgi:LPS sulfotransferase NodH
MWGTMERIASGLRGACGDTARTDLELLAFAFGPDLKFVHLRREDRIAQAVSWARAEQTGYWQVGDPRFAEPAYDFAVIDTYVRTIREHELAWRDWFTRFGVNVYEIEYERLVASPAGTVRALGDYLGVDLAVGAPITAADQRQADRINFEWARRFRLDGGEG